MSDKPKVLQLIKPGQDSSRALLTAASKVELTGVVILGWDDAGSMYFRCADDNGPNVLWLLEQARDQLLAGGREEDEPA